MPLCLLRDGGAVDAEKVDRELVRAWVEGWVVSRLASPPVEEEWGFSFDVALPKHITRHVLPEADEELAVKLMAAFTGPAPSSRCCCRRRPCGPGCSRGGSWTTPGS